jgi:hypothetical protein
LPHCGGREDEGQMFERVCILNINVLNSGLRCLAVYL